MYIPGSHDSYRDQVAPLGEKMKVSPIFFVVKGEFQNEKWMYSFFYFPLVYLLAKL